MINSSLFISLFAAHLVGDFYLQTDSLCQQKADKKAKSWFLYLHTFVMAALSWLVVFQSDFLGCFVLIFFSHGLIDLIKSCLPSNLWAFILDQLLHLSVLAGISAYYDPVAPIPLDMLPVVIRDGFILLASLALCCKPANILIKLVLKNYAIGEGQTCEAIKNAGALIGNLERILTVIFVLIGQYEAVGFIIAAKSILRFKDTDTAKTEYVLAGTFLSFGIAIVTGLLIDRWLFS